VAGGPDDAGQVLSLVASASASASAQVLRSPIHVGDHLLGAVIRGDDDVAALASLRIEAVVIDDVPGKRVVVRIYLRHGEQCR
jgi:hypothetical protein